MPRSKEQQKAYNHEYYLEHKGQRKTKTSAAAVARYVKKNYRQFSARIKPELMERIEAYTTAEKISKPKFLSRAIDALNEGGKTK